MVWLFEEADTSIEGEIKKQVKALVFWLLKYERSSPSADNVRAQNTQIKRTTSFTYGHGEQSKPSKRIRNPFFTENKISKNFSDG